MAGGRGGRAGRPVLEAELTVELHLLVSCGDRVEHELAHVALHHGPRLSEGSVDVAAQPPRHVRVLHLLERGDAEAREDLVELPLDHPVDEAALGVLHVGGVDGRTGARRLRRGRWAVAPRQRRIEQRLRHARLLLRRAATRPLLLRRAAPPLAARHIERRHPLVAVRRRRHAKQLARVRRRRSSAAARPAPRRRPLRTKVGEPRELGACPSPPPSTTFGRVSARRCARVLGVRVVGELLAEQQRIAFQTGRRSLSLKTGPSRTMASAMAAV